MVAMLAVPMIAGIAASDVPPVNGVAKIAANDPIACGRKEPKSYQKLSPCGAFSRMLAASFFHLSPVPGCSPSNQSTTSPPKYFKPPLIWSYPASTPVDRFVIQP